MFLLLMQTLQAQMMHPFIEANKAWDEYFITDIDLSAKRFFIDNITQNGGSTYGTLKSYTLVNQDIVGVFLPPNLIIDSNQVQIEMYLREESATGRLYGNMPGATEKILFDFSMNVGDTTDLGYTLTSTTNTTLLNGQQRYTMVFDSVIQVIDGIGCTFNFKAVSILQNAFSSYLLACVKHNNNYIYGDYCATFTPVQEATTTEPSISVYPNPAAQTINIEGINPNDLLTIYDNLGQIVVQGHYHENEAIDLSQLKAGLYLCSINGQYKTKIIKIDE